MNFRACKSKCNLMQTRFKDLDLDEVEDMEEENKDKEGGEDR